MSSRTQFAGDQGPEQFRRRGQLGKGPVASISLVFSGAAKSRFLWLDAVYRERYQTLWSSKPNWVASKWQMISKHFITRANITNCKLNSCFNNSILHPFITHLLKARHKDEQDLTSRSLQGYRDTHD